MTELTSISPRSFFETNALARLKGLADRAVRLFASDESFGGYTYRRYPGLGRAWGGAMNGQRNRCLLVGELIALFHPIAIVETGTYLGMTTEWLASFQLPIHSCEAVAHNFGFAKARLSTMPNVHLVHADSRAALNTFLEGPLGQQLDQPILFYLDAHWFDDLPLDDEMRIIFGRCPRAIVLIDDFKVPHDPAYGFDDYGEGKVLDAAYLANVMKLHDLSIVYPITPAAQETGARRGCSVVVGPQLAELLSQVELLSRPVASGIEL